MKETCVPYQRKSLYLFLTIPMIGMYIAIAVFLWNVDTTYFLIYCGLFVLVAITQSYVCAYFQCPYVGKFAPCVGGFCLPSGQIARLFKNAKRSESLYKIFVSLSFAAFLGIILLPMYFLYAQSVAYFLTYKVIVLLYAGSFLGFICPVCGTRHVCPGGQTSTKLMGMVREKLT
jgi:hypothetical protein